MKTSVIEISLQTLKALYRAEQAAAKKRAIASAKRAAAKRAAAKAIKAAKRAADRETLKAKRAADKAAGRQVDYNPNGVVLFETAEYVVIATGLEDKSDNVKTGGMVQVWILAKGINPLAATKNGLDSIVCGDCKHRGEIVDGVLTGRRCYVTVWQAPLSIWNCYDIGGYRTATADEYPALFGGRVIRWGAYGDPVLIPIEIVSAISAVASGWTGYTHQWSNETFTGYREYLMASVDNDRETAAAIAADWRYFRVRPESDQTVAAGEIRCPASKEGGHRTTCNKCKLCSGGRYSTDERKSITIIDHSAIKASNPLISITV